MQDLLRDTTQQQTSYFPAAVTAHYNQIGWPFLGRIDDLGGRNTRLKKFGNRLVCLDALSELGQQMLRFSLGHFHELVRWHTPHRAGADRWIKYVNKTHLSLEWLRQLNRDIRRMGRELTFVHRNENFFEAHFFAPAF